MSSRPSSTRRRFHRDRVIANRIRQARLVSLNDPAQYVRGRLANYQRYLGCHRPRCGLCRPHKRWSGGERRREEREWREIEGC